MEPMGTASFLDLAFYFSGQREGARYNFVCTDWAKIHLVNSFGLCSETDSPIVPFNLLLLLIFVSWETKYNSN